MPLKIISGHPAICIRKDAYEKSGVARSELDSNFSLTDEEFRVEGNVVVLGPLPSDDSIGPMVDFLEGKGLLYFDDFFELSGNWPEWLQIYAG